ncbi:U-box domain-containing protein 15 [Dionaea muscipula]
MNLLRSNKSQKLTPPWATMAGDSERGKIEDFFEEDNLLSLPSPREITNVIQLVEREIELICSIGDYRVTQRKESLSLVRRIKLLLPFLDEIKELGEPIPEPAQPFLHDLKKAIFAAKKLLKICSESSKIYLASEYEAMVGMFHSVNGKLSEVLDKMPYDEIGISDETKEQVELMRVQLKRAKRRTDTQDMELAMDMMVVFSKEDDRNADIAMIKRLAKNLELHTVEDLNEESVAVRKLAKEKGGKYAENIQKIINVLNKFKQIAGIEETDLFEDPVKPEEPVKCHPLDIPQEFLCPITLEIMTDPVIVATGQTYERASIQKWLDSNHRTCPKTGQVLSHLSLAPNYALKNLILQWCEKNNVELPNKNATTGTEDASTAENREKIMSLVQDLLSVRLVVQKEAVQSIRLLSKENPENRVLIADCGGIPPLVQLLSYPDSKIQEHAVTALLNLSIDDTNKKLMSSQGAISAIIQVLKHGNVGAKENSAATLFSLSMVDENKVTVGLLNGVPPLVDLLQHGTIRGKKDAATALFNLCLNHMNKARAVEAGIVKPLLQLLTDSKLGMIDESLSILLLLVSHPEGRQEIGQLSFIETLVEFMRSGTQKNKEGAAAVLLELGIAGSSFLLAALQYGVYEHLVGMTKNGTNRAQRKASSILQLMSKYEQIP